MKKADICVYGGTSAGIVAAAAAAEMGKSVALVSPMKHLGGLSSSGLGATDMGNQEVIGGMARQFYQRLAKAYGMSGELWRFAPSKAEQVFEAWVKEANVELLRGLHVTAARREGARLKSITLSDGSELAAERFIDASYEGDLIAAAGLSWTLGREAASQYGEDLAGVRPATKHAGFKVPVDPYKVPGRPESGLLEGIPSGDGQPTQPGAADSRVQAYNYRMCLTQDEPNFLAIPKPEDYRPERYEILGRYLEALVKDGRPVKFSHFFLIVKMPGGKTDFNNTGGFSTNLPGGSWGYALASPEERRAIERRHQDHIKGLFHFLRTDPRTPRAVRREAETWGLCRDEFTDNGGWPHHIYVREGRRLVGESVFTQLDCEKGRDFEDPIGMGSYSLDVHPCRRTVSEAGFVANEDGVERPVQPYAFPYSLILPRKAEAENLLAPVPMSASHVAFGSLRMEPVFMILGEAAGLAAALSLDKGAAVQDIDRPGLSRLLAKRGAVTRFDSSKSSWNKEEWPHDPYVFQSYQWWAL